MIYVFNGNENSYPSGIFLSKENALEFIKKYELSGVLTLYPIDISVYDWVLDKGYFKIKQDYQKKGSFISKFSSAYLKHWHIENGQIGILDLEN